MTLEPRHARAERVSHVDIGKVFQTERTKVPKPREGAWHVGELAGWTGWINWATKEQ